MKKQISKFSVALLSAFALIGCSSPSGGDGGGGATISGVWQGSYTGPSPTSGAAPQGPICLQINQSGTQVNGKAWISGYLWNVNYTGTLSGSSLTGSFSGQDLNGNTVNVDYNFSVSGNNITGKVTITIGSNTYTYDVSLTKSTSKSDCGWASRELANAFGRALGNASGNSALGTALASFITEVPRVNVRINGTDYQNWWVCIWEVREKDSSGTPTREYTLGGIIDDQTLQGAIGWYVVEESGTGDLNSPPHFIGLASDHSQRTVSFTDLGGSSPKVAGYYDFQSLLNSFTADGNNNDDKYQTDGTSLNSGSQPFFVSECDSSTNTQFKVWMTTINNFCITFNNTTFSRSASAPPDACTVKETVPALYIEKVACTP